MLLKAMAILAAKLAQGQRMPSASELKKRRWKDMPAHERWQTEADQPSKRWKYDQPRQK